MRINYDKLERMGFHVEKTEKGVDIFPRSRKDISEDLQCITELPMRDCYRLQEEIHDLQVLNAIKSCE